MASISMNHQKMQEEMSKEGTGGSGKVHPAGTYSFTCIAIEYNMMNGITKQQKSPYLFFHWRSELGIQKDYCSLSELASFNFANRVKATKALISNLSVINYAGLIGRTAEIVIEHEKKPKTDGTGEYTVSNAKFFNVDPNAQMQIADLSNPQFEHLPTVMNGYVIEAPQSFGNDAPPPNQMPQQNQYQQQQGFQQSQQNMNPQQGFQQGQPQQGFHQPNQNAGPQADPYQQNFQQQGQGQQAQPQANTSPIVEDDLPF